RVGMSRIQDFINAGRGMIVGGMTRRTFVASAAGLQKKPLNVVFFLTDDHGAWALNHAGCKELHTPNLDRLASEGARFDNAFAATPVCSPSRATYLTGRLPSHHGIQDFLLFGFRPGMANDCAGPTAKQFLAGQPTFSESLAKAGYKVGLSGKWHIGQDDRMQAGFSYWATVPGGGGTFRDATFVKNGETVKTSGMKTDRVGDFGIEFLNQTGGQPFCLFMPFYAPHTPYDFQSNEYRRPYENSKFGCFPRLPVHPWRMRTLEGAIGGTLKDDGNEESMRSYSALITAMDHNVGRVLTHLDRMGVRDNTVVVFTADQGHNCGHHGLWGKGNATIPFNMYEESIRVPLIWSHRGRIKPGLRLSRMVSSYDFMPTLLDYVGVAAPEDRHRAGESYAGLLNATRSEDREELYFEYEYVRAVRTKRWKYIHRVEGWPSELFDLQNDPGEERNVLETPAGRKTAVELQRKLQAFFERKGAPPIEQWRSTTRQVLPRYGRN
ncbi:MAG: sulfatase-like hydrolase/transferase, partial [Bryobacter sp.]|nr:sulfatase-like hydrolase/transferase [Bryobacter sp.]